MKQKQTVAIYIGRFQPYHNAHAKILKHCVETFDHTIVLVGSTNQRVSTKNPFTYEQRRDWIIADQPSVIVRPLIDFIYDDAEWVAQINPLVFDVFNPGDYEFHLVGHHKDDSSYYLDIFPNFKYYEMPEIYSGISGTMIRDAWFYGVSQYWTMRVPEPVSKTMRSMSASDVYKDLTEEFEYYRKEREMFRDYPFPETLRFTCADSVVVCNEHVLLIRRKNAPGKGTWALPGGFVNQNETFRQCAIRELKEETGINVLKEVLNNAIVNHKLFDSPKRNLGIPRITDAFYYYLLPEDFEGPANFPEVAAADDAADIKWFPISDIRDMKLYDDHADIIGYFL